MRTVVYTQRFHGRLTGVGPGLLDAALSDPGQARICSQLTFLDEHRFREEGTIDFGDGRVLPFRTIGEGHLGDSPDPRFRHGTAARDIDAGRGRMTSNFLVAADGTVTDDEVAVIFINEQEEPPCAD
jgi:hypothetical protein